MGVEMKSISVKLSEARLRKLARFEDAFTPLVNNRTDVFNLMIDLLDEMLPKFETLPRFTMALTILGALGRLQDLLRPTLCVETHSSEGSQVQIEFPVHQERPVGLIQTLPTLSHRFQLLNRPENLLGHAAELVAAAYKPLSLPGLAVRPYYVRRVA